MKKLLTTCLIILVLTVYPSGNLLGETPIHVPTLGINRELTIDGDPQGHLGMKGIVVYAFSQSDIGGSDTQIFKLLPDINIRAWHLYHIKDNVSFGTEGIKQYHINNIKFIGGGTASVTYDGMTGYGDHTTRTAGNRLVRDGNLPERCYRASLASPIFRKMVIDYCKQQIDCGVDGLFLDEANGAGYLGRIHEKKSGESDKSYLGYIQWKNLTLYYDYNEGFDNYFISDFNRYLMNKYPDFDESDWISNFGMCKDNVIHRDRPFNDLKNNFNYRKYLAKNGWDKDPHNPANPLSKEWGLPRINRMSTNEETFMNKYLKLYWKEIVVEVRTYAREKYKREIWITSNGIFPYVDFNSLGMYDGNGDDDGVDADYIPITNGHLNGSKSLKRIYLKLLKDSQEVSGPVPLTLFIDCPGTMANRYSSLPVTEKMDFWRIYGAEMYACGLFPTLHLRTSQLNEATATSSGVMDFFVEYSRFYKEHKDLYQCVANTGKALEVGIKDVEYNVTFQAKRERYLIHLINHNYEKRLVPQNGFTVSMKWEGNPVSVRLLSPDKETSTTLQFHKEQNRLIIDINKIDAYDVVVIQM